MQLSLSSDFGSPAHWRRVLDFAREQGVERVVYWGDPVATGYPNWQPPFLYPRYPGLLPEEWRPRIGQLREHFAEVADLVSERGIELWYVFQVLELPALEHARAVLPELFNEAGEPDCAGETFAELLRNQLDELAELVPSLAGVEMWVMECAAVQIARLDHQRLTRRETCARIVEIVHEHLTNKGLRLTQDLHTSGGDTETLEGLLDGARRHADIVVSADNTAGDYHLQLPFNEHLVRAAETNPIQVNFDLNGEYWGRNLVPTSALKQYESHLERARELGAVWVNGRVATEHDMWMPHANVRASRRGVYAGLAALSDDAPLPTDLEVACTDTINAFNAEFFCRRARDPRTAPADVVREFLERELGAPAAELVPVFLEIQEIAAKLFFVDGNYFCSQSALPRPEWVDVFALGAQLRCPPGTAFPTAEALAETKASRHPLAFDGWPVARGHRCAGVDAMLAEKSDALSRAECQLARVREIAPRLRADDGAFLVRQFEDLVIYARAARLLLEAIAHRVFREAGISNGSIPYEARLDDLSRELHELAARWADRYPGGRYRVDEIVRSWVAVITAETPDC